jgi:hypothetical protein
MVAAVCALFGAQPAMAQPYPAAEPMLMVSAATVSAGEEVQLTGNDYGPDEAVAIDVTGHSYYWQVKADGHGRFTTAVRLTHVGTVVIKATGRSTGRTASVKVTVLSSGAVQPGHGAVPPGQGPSLPVTSATGFDLPATLLVGTMAMLAGLGLVLLSVRWRRRRPSSSLA